MSKPTIDRDHLSRLIAALSSMQDEIEHTARNVDELRLDLEGLDAPEQRDPSKLTITDKVRDYDNHALKLFVVTNFDRKTGTYLPPIGVLAVDEDRARNQAATVTEHINKEDSRAYCLPFRIQGWGEREF